MKLKAQEMPAAESGGSKGKGKSKGKSKGKGKSETKAAQLQTQPIAENRQPQKAASKASGFTGH